MYAVKVTALENASITTHTGSGEAVVRNPNTRKLLASALMISLGFHCLSAF